MKKRLLFTVVLTILLTAVLSICTYAADTDYTFFLSADKTAAFVGDEITVSLTIRNNKAESYSVYTMQDYVHYDSEAVSIVSGSMTTAKNFKATDQSGRIYINRYSTNGISATGDFTILTFKVKLLKAGEAVFTHSVPEIAGQRIELYSVDTVDLTVQVTEPLYGDADGDGKVTAEDLAALTRYLAGWDGYQNIDTAVLDLNKDGKLNNVDVAILARHLADWEGYDSIPLA